ncbi:putative guanine nucleotide exchange factor MCF2L2 [Lamellibrachia satsuma]|nr:putative guanine nucleotide exchange factor MCF2L2 [Lamellibrachia satsuma]
MAIFTTVHRLLLQLGETESNFDKFWTGHQLKLNQCLLLRRFEEDFKQLQYIVECHLVALRNMVEIGDSIQRVETLLRELKELDDCAKEDIDRADELDASGRQFIEEDHYAIDCIRPKCIELQQMVQQYREMTQARFSMLERSRDLHDRIDKANKWCTRGVDLLAGQQIDQSTNMMWAQRSLDDISVFLRSVDDLRLHCPREFHSLFDSILTPTTQEMVRDVIHRIDDVKNMCEKRCQNLRRLTEKPVRPVQPVAPEQVAPPARSHKHHNTDRKRKRMNHREGSTEKGSMEIVVPHWSENERVMSHDMSRDMDTHNASHSMASVDPSEAKQGTKRTFMRHVMNELIESERIYVAELHSILQASLSMSLSGSRLFFLCSPSFS